ncbi:hypothetical protein BDQ94DRAFT_135422 [Aspergillus welwitschiae]|uniref:Uncharacterized protein n=1 Tax=Aspergillus welwitschiae TaxID=1341132 RepID=A0A3F3QFE5_9EURO|nr:hypothetical protein BDQ94DRAFT_135422 [Aspergillus welwitschiae]RDH37973.1 hypothetical protein BDQ94DRAFT_135422 [Aspergillus welwitschiae]
MKNSDDTAPPGYCCNLQEATLSAVYLIGAMSAALEEICVLVDLLLPHLMHSGSSP